MKRPGHATRIAGILKKSDTARGALKKIMRLQFRIIADSRRQALTRVDPEDLHDLRVAMRRFRAVLRMCRDEWPGRRARGLARSLRALSTESGPIRDAQVRLEFLESRRTRRRCSRDARWKNHVGMARRRAGLEVRRLRRMLAGRTCASLVNRLAAFLRAGLPKISAAASDASFRSFGSAKLRRIHRRIMRHRIDPSVMEPEEFHELRRLCRRARYWAEFLAPVSGRLVKELAARLKGIADALGDLHDADVHLDRLASGPPRSLPSLRALLRKDRQAALADFKKAWKKLRRDEFRDAVVDRLAALRKRR